MERFGDFYKEWRTVNKLTLKELSQETGISFQNLSRWERNQVSPPIEACVILADYYGISLDELIGRAIPPVKPEQHKSEK